MFVAFQALNYDSAKRFVELSQNRSNKKVHTYDSWYLVSVTDPGYTPICNEPTENILPMQFYDINADKIDVGRDADNRGVFRRRHARQICDFIRTAHAAPGNNLFLANCMYGVSRSGAITEFARRVCGGSQSKFDKMNPMTNPNKYVLRLLEEEWEYYASFAS